VARGAWRVLSSNLSICRTTHHAQRTTLRSWRISFFGWENSPENGDLQESGEKIRPRDLKPVIEVSGMAYRGIVIGKDRRCVRIGISRNEKGEPGLAIKALRG